MDANATASIEAKIGINPRQSQTFLVALIVLSCVTIICGTILVGMGQMFGAWLFLLALLFVFSAAYAWFKSQPDSDLHHSHPASIQLPDGTSVTADSRLLLKTEGIAALVRLCSEVMSRRPLPDPDGLVDANLQLIQDSKEDAVKFTSQLNLSTQEATNDLVKVLNLADENPSILQECATPPTKAIRQEDSRASLNSISKESL